MIQFNSTPHISTWNPLFIAINIPFYGCQATPTQTCCHFQIWIKDTDTFLDIVTSMDSLFQHSLALPRSQSNDYWCPTPVSLLLPLLVHLFIPLHSLNVAKRCLSIHSLPSLHLHFDPFWFWPCLCLCFRTLIPLFAVVFDPCSLMSHMSQIVYWDFVCSDIFLPAFTATWRPFCDIYKSSVVCDMLAIVIRSEHFDEIWGDTNSSGEKRKRFRPYLESELHSITESLVVSAFHFPIS